MAMDFIESLGYDEESMDEEHTPQRHTFNFIRQHQAKRRRERKYRRGRYTELL
jgi:hypothetical protein